MRLVCVLCLVAAALLVAACGNDSGSGNQSPDETPAGAATKSDFVAQADRICRTRNKQIDALNKQLDAVDQGDYEGAAAVYKKGQRITEVGLAQLRTLEPPPRDRAAVAKWTAALDVQLVLSGRLVRAIERQDDETISVLTDEIERAKEKAHGIAQGYGLKVCGTD